MVPRTDLGAPKGSASPRVLVRSTRGFCWEKKFMAFKSVPSRYNGPELEKRILDFWRANQIFEKSLAQSRDRPLYTFNEGPPTANGRPGIHHVLAR